MSIKEDGTRVKRGVREINRYLRRKKKHPRPWSQPATLEINGSDTPDSD